MDEFEIADWMMRRKETDKERGDDYGELQAPEYTKRDDIISKMKYKIKH